MEPFWTKPISPLEQSLILVTPLRHKGEKAFVGTGFYHQWNNKHYLVTCYHVLAVVEGVLDEWVAVMHEGLSSGGLTRTSIDVKFRVPDHVLVCPEADLAVVELQPVAKNAAVVSPQASGKSHVPLDTKLVLLGYPEGIYDTHHNVPTVRSGHSASCMDLGWCGDPLLALASLPVYKGDSGAPVMWHESAGIVTQDSTNPLVFNVQKIANIGLLGIHCGGYNPLTSKWMGVGTNPVQLGVFIKAEALAKGFDAWVKMETLKEDDYAHPRKSTSEHSPHAARPTRAEFDSLSSLSGRTDAKIEEQTKRSSEHSPSMTKALFDSLVSSNNSPGALDEELWLRLGQKLDVTLCNVTKRLKWRCRFNEMHRLLSMEAGSQMFVRTNLPSVPSPGDLRLIAQAAGGDAIDLVSIFHVLPTEKKDMAVSGARCDNVPLGQDDYPDEESVVSAWNVVEQ
jgi:hypothetical protein